MGIGEYRGGNHKVSTPSYVKTDFGRNTINAFDKMEEIRLRKAEAIDKKKEALARRQQLDNHKGLDHSFRQSEAAIQQSRFEKRMAFDKTKLKSEEARADKAENRQNTLDAMTAHKYNIAVEDYDNNVDSNSFIMPDFSTKEIEVDTDVVESSKTNADLLESMNKKAIEDYNKFNKDNPYDLSEAQEADLEAIINEKDPKAKKKLENKFMAQYGKTEDTRSGLQKFGSFITGLIDDSDTSSKNSTIKDVINTYTTRKNFLSDLDTRYKDDTKYTDKTYKKAKKSVPTTIEEQIALAEKARKEYQTKSMNAGVDAKTVIAMIEGGIDPKTGENKYDVRNPYAQTVRGKYQFTDKTNAEVAKKMGVSVEYLRTPEGQEKAMDFLIEDNGKQLDSMGLPRSLRNTYFIHQLGSVSMRKLNEGNYDDVLMYHITNNLTSKDMEKLGFKDSKTSEGAARRDILKGMDKAKRQKIAQYWTDKYGKLVDKYSKGKGKVNPYVLKQFDNKLSSLREQLAAKNSLIAEQKKEKIKQTTEKIKQTTELTKAESKNMSDMAKKAYELDMKRYTQAVKDGKLIEGATAPRVSDYTGKLANIAPVKYSTEE